MRKSMISKLIPNLENCTLETRQFVWLMRILTVVYALVGLLFFFMPEETFYLINVGPKVFKAFDDIPMPSEHFWVALSGAMMAMLTVVAFYSSVYPQTKSFVVIHAVSKITSVLGFSFLFLNKNRYYAYFIGAFTDAGIILAVLYFYFRSLRSMKKSTQSALKGGLSAAG